jgi:hypothetical protein
MMHMIIVVISWSRERISERDQGSENSFMAWSLLQSVFATKAWFFWVVVVGTICTLNPTQKRQFTAVLTHSTVAIHRYHQRYRRCRQVNWVCGKNVRCVYIKDGRICIKTLVHIQVAEDSKGVAERAWHTRDTITLRQASNCSCNHNNNDFEP